MKEGVNVPVDPETLKRLMMMGEMTFGEPNPKPKAVRKTTPKGEKRHSKRSAASLAEAEESEKRAKAKLAPEEADVPPHAGNQVEHDAYMHKKATHIIAFVDAHGPKYMDGDQPLSSCEVTQSYDLPRDQEKLDAHKARAEEKLLDAQKKAAEGLIFPPDGFVLGAAVRGHGLCAEDFAFPIDGTYVQQKRPLHWTRQPDPVQERWAASSPRKKYAIGIIGGAIVGAAVGARLVRTALAIQASLDV